jgi:hypothetical protein
MGSLREDDPGAANGGPTAAGEFEIDLVAVTEFVSKGGGCVAFARGS